MNQRLSLEIKSGSVVEDSGGFGDSFLEDDLLSHDVLNMAEAFPFLKNDQPGFSEHGNVRVIAGPALAALAAEVCRGDRHQ